ncbi:MAG: EMC3/TMCO1 family protein [Candidatus Thorarchaeota archaeon]
MDIFSDLILTFSTMPWSAITILVVNVFLALISIWATNRFTDMEKMKADMEEVKIWREKMNVARKTMDPVLLDEVMADQGRIMKINGAMMGARMKPMCVYYIPFLIVFWIMGTMFGNSIVAVLPFNIQKVLPFLEGMFGTATIGGFGFTFYGFYLLVGLGLGNLIRKPFGQSMTA